jgi:hypothetical protein
VKRRSPSIVYACVLILLGCTTSSLLAQTSGHGGGINSGHSPSFTPINSFEFTGQSSSIPASVYTSLTIHGPGTMVSFSHVGVGKIAELAMIDGPDLKHANHLFKMYDVKVTSYASEGTGYVATMTVGQIYVTERKKDNPMGSSIYAGDVNLVNTTK